MKPHQDILHELRQAGIELPETAFVTPYAVPEGYFDAFVSLLMTEIRRQEAREELEAVSPLLASLPKRMPFAVPEGFFQEAAGETPALLATIDRNGPYEVPQGYFEQLPGRMIAAVAPAPAKVVGMRPVRWMRFAAAAVVAAALAVGGWFYSQSTPGVPAGSQAWVQKKLNNVPDGVLEEFIQTTDPNQNTGLAASENHKTTVRQLLRDVSDHEMDAFLEAVPAGDETNNVN